MGCSHSDNRVASVRYEEEPLEAPLKIEEEIKTKRTIVGSVDTGSMSESQDSYLRPPSSRIRGVYLTVDTHLKSWDELDEATPSPIRSKPLSQPLTPEVQQKRVQELMVKPDKAAGFSGRFLMTRSESFIDRMGTPPQISGKSGRFALARSESIVSRKSVEPEIAPEAGSARRSSSSRDGSARFSLTRNESRLSSKLPSSSSPDENEQAPLPNSSGRDAVFSPSSSRSRSTSVTLPPRNKMDVGIALSGSRRPSIEEQSSSTRRNSLRATPELPERAVRIPRSPSVASAASTDGPAHSRPPSILLAASPSLPGDDVMAPTAVNQVVSAPHKRAPPSAKKQPRTPPSIGAVNAAVSAAVTAAVAATTAIVRAPTPHPHHIKQPAVDLTPSEKQQAPALGSEQQSRDGSNNGILANIVDMLLLAHPLSGPRPFSTPPKMSPQPTVLGLAGVASTATPAVTDRETPVSPFQVSPDYVHVNPEEVLSCFYVQPDSWYKAPRPYLRVKIIPFVWWR